MKSKEIISRYLSLFNDNAFRKSSDVTSAGFIHQEQLEAAKEVVCELAANIVRTNHVILVAKMQSGKTGTCNAITNMIMTTALRKELAVKRVLFITGMNDCGLANQTYERVLEQVIPATDSNIYDGTKATAKNKNCKYYVLKNSNLKKFTEDINGSLIFIDEAHFGSKERNVLTKFMLSKGIDWKNKNSLISNNVYIVSVSATPFEEIISDTAECKPMVILKTSDNYVGVSEYIEKGLIHQATKNDIDDGSIFSYIEDAYERMEENSEKGIVIVRTRKFDAFYANKFITDNFDIHEMYASGSKIEYDKLNDIMTSMVEKNNANNKADYTFDRAQSALVAQGEKTPSVAKVEIKPLLVLIKGAFRAGITITRKAKDLIYMIYDYSAGADTTAQALLGRMCGYRDIEHTVFNTHFYLNSVFAQMYADWENDFKNKELVPCSKTKWVWMDKEYQGSDIQFGTKSCGNFAINLTSDDVKEIYFACGQHTRGQNKSTAEILPKILKKYHKEIEYDYFIEAYMSGRQKYAKSVVEKRFDAFSSDSLVFQIIPDKNKDFQEATGGRKYFTKEDLGKKAVGVVFDVVIEVINGKITLSGNRRLLIYYVEVGQKKRMANHQTQYQPHKDTSLID
ncbi:MAG: DEAD/DEAH box helicase family protein [Lachnospiraceae bacterium]|nr:DEAD/DEAH box helicase family protein [Lachnospiraceae bacterium]